jgi:predicted DNA-binding ribbon-helix-helix protein
MCRIYAGTSPAEYEQVTRSVRLNRAVTSIRLENRFWTLLDRMAAEEGVSLPRFLSVLYDEVLDLHGEVRNFASLLRVACTTYLAGKGASVEPLTVAAARGFAVVAGHAENRPPTV